MTLAFVHMRDGLKSLLPMLPVLFFFALSFCRPAPVRTQQTLYLSDEVSKRVVFSEFLIRDDGKFVPRVKEVE